MVGEGDGLSKGKTIDVYHLVSVIETNKRALQAQRGD